VKFVDNILYKEESYKIIGACFEVYNELGYVYLEALYQKGPGKRISVAEHTLYKRLEH